MLFQELFVDGAKAGIRLDLFLTRHFLHESNPSKFSRSEIQRLIGKDEVTLNGSRVKPNARVKANDLIQVQRLPARASALEPEALPLNVLYEDEDCIVINKPAGIVVHPAAGRTKGTLVNALLYHCPGLEGIGGERRPGIVHRLDKDTSGVMVIAKNAPAFRQLARQFMDRSVTKEYLGLVWGRMNAEAGVINRPIGRHRSDRKRMSSIHSLSRKRDAVTEWCVEGYFPRIGDIGLSLLRLMPRTGRTHQIRVHLADLGFPLLGEKLYGQRRKKNRVKQIDIAWLDLFPRHALHAEKLVIHHPRTDQQMEFHAPLPDDLRNLLSALERYKGGNKVIFSE